ncbi:hypothetical protein PV325_013989 [Microctonus aethiopoides]|nr:hypothetical protein PV325_013989 [Microctonus aethiopoides]
MDYAPSTSLGGSTNGAARYDLPLLGCYYLMQLFGRWGMLSAGILYGIFHQSRLSKKEAAFREVDDKRKAIRDKQLAIEKKLAADAEMKQLEAMMK